MQRIRYGLTGLAFVFVMVMIGTAVVRSGEEPTTNVAVNAVRTPSDPLAELGVAPGQGSENDSADETAQAPQPPR